MKIKLLFVLVPMFLLTGCDILSWLLPGEEPPGFGMGAIESPAEARDAAIDYVNQTDPGANIPTDVEWAEENITPTGLVGFSTFRYTIAGPSTMEWEIIVRFPVIPQPDYKVEIRNIATGGYWQVLVGYGGEVEPIPPVTLKGEAVVEAEGTRSESWGLLVLEGPEDYIGKGVGLKSYTEMKSQLEPHLGLRMKAVVNKVCRSFDQAEGCCASAFELCAPVVLELMPDIED